MNRAEVLAKVLAEHNDTEGGLSPRSQRMLVAALDAALAAQEGEGCTCYPGGFTGATCEGPQRDCPVHGERGGAENVEAERWEEGHSQGVIDYMNRHQPDLSPDERLLRAVMLVDAWEQNPYRIEAQS